MMTTTRILLIALILSVLCGCTPNRVAVPTNQNTNEIFRVTLYQEGKEIRRWNAIDTPEVECHGYGNSSVLEFHEGINGTLVKVTGTVVVEIETWDKIKPSAAATILTNVEVTIYSHQ